MFPLSKTFNESGSLSSDTTDNSQRNLLNMKFSNYNLDNHMNEYRSDSHVNFALRNPTVNFRSTVGGLPGDIIDKDSELLLKKDHEEKLQLNQRPFATVPYLGRGPGNIDMESKLLQGEANLEKKSENTVMNKEFIDYNKYPLNDDLKNRFNDPSRSIEEMALDGWVRGGAPTRETSVNKEK